MFPPPYIHMYWLWYWSIAMVSSESPLMVNDGWYSAPQPWEIWRDRQELDGFDRLALNAALLLECGWTNPYGECHKLRVGVQIQVPGLGILEATRILIGQSVFSNSQEPHSQLSPCAAGLFPQNKQKGCVGPEAVNLLKFGSYQLLYRLFAP